MQLGDIKYLSDEGTRLYLYRLIDALDELDSEDFFGTEGWRRRLLGED